MGVATVSKVLDGCWVVMGMLVGTASVLVDARLVGVGLPVRVEVRLAVGVDDKLSFGVEGTLSVGVDVALSVGPGVTLSAGVDLELSVSVDVTLSVEPADVVLPVCVSENPVSLSDGVLVGSPSSVVLGVEEADDESTDGEP